jgi:hypothetical protein
MTRDDLLRFMRKRKLAMPGCTHVRVRPMWARYSDFNQDPPLIVELTAP